MAVAGLQSEAVLKLKVQLDSKDLTGTKKLLTDLTNAFKAQSAAKGTDTLLVAFKNLRKELSVVKRELNDYKKAQSAAKAADTQASAAKKAQKAAWLQLAIAINKVKAAEKANSQAARVSTAQAKNQAKAEQARARALKSIVPAMAAVIRGNLASTASQQREARATRAAVAEMERRRRALDKLQAAQRKQQAIEDRLNKTYAGRAKLFKDQLLKQISEAEESVDALFRASYRLSMVGNTLRNVSQSIVSFGTDIMSTFGDFEYMMIRAAGTMEIWRDAGERGALTYADLQEKILGLAASMKMFSAQDIAEAMYFWGSTTGQVVESQEDLAVATSALDTIMKAAVMTNTSYEQTIKGVYSILTQYYGGALDKAVEVTEKLFYTTQKTAAEFSDMIAAFKMVGPIAAQMGVSFDEVNETLATLADLGLRGTMAGRALRQMFIQTIRPSIPASKAMDQLFAEPANQARFGEGATYKNQVFPEGEYVGITKQVEILAKATQNLNTEQRNYYLAKIATANELPMLTALVAKATLEIKGMATAEDKLADSGTKAAQAFRRNWEGMSQSWNAIKGSVERAIESLKINLGSIMAQTLKPFMEYLTQIIRRVETFLKVNPEIVEFATQIGVLIAAITGIAGYFLVAAGAAVGLAAAIGLIVKSLNPWASTITTIGGAFSLLIIAIADNFEYLYDAISEILDNIAEAFGITGDAATGLADAFMEITAPARELVGFVVRLTADIAVMASEIFGLVGVLNQLTGGGLLTFIGAALSAIVSAKVVMGVASLTKNFLGLAAAMRIVRTAAPKGGGIMAAWGLENTKAASAGVRGMVSSAGGLAGLALTLGILAYEIFPPFKEFVDGIIQPTNDWANSVAKLSDEFGTLGASLSQLSMDAAQKFFKVFEARGATKQAWANMVPGMKYDWDVIEAGANAAELQKAAEEMAAKTNEAITRSFKAANEKAIMDNDPLISGENWARMVMGTAKGMGTDNLALAAAVAKSIADNLGSDATSSEVLALLERNPGGLLSNIPPEVFLDLAGLVANIGDESEAISEGIAKAISSALDMAIDPKEMGMYITKPLAELGGFSIAGVAAGEGDFNDSIVQLAQEVMKGHQNSIVIAAENQAASITGYEDSLKRAILSMTTLMFENSFPNYFEFSGAIEGLALSGQYEEIAALMMEQVLGDGTTNAVLDAIEKGAPGASEFATIIKTIIDNGYGSPEFIAMFGGAAEEAGEEAGQEARRGWIEGLSSASSLKLSAEEVKGLMGMGTGRDAVDRIMKGLTGKRQQRLEGGGLFARQAAWDRDKTFMSGLEDFTEGRGQKGVRIVTRQLTNNWDKLSEHQQRGAAKFILTNTGITEKLQTSVGAVMSAINPWRGAGTSTTTTTTETGGGEKGGGKGTKAGKDAGKEVLTGVSTSAASFDYSGFIGEVYTGITAAIPGSTLPLAGIEIAKSVATGFTNSMSISGGAGGSAAVGSFAANSVAGAVGGIKAQGAVVAARLVEGFRTGMLANNASGAITTMVQNSVAGAIGSIEQGGYNIGFSWASGFARGVQANTTVITASFMTSTEAGLGESPPKKGPLKNIDKWGYNVGSAWGENFAKGSVDKARKMGDEVRALRLDRAASFGSKTEFTHNSKKEVTVKLQVSSPDGTVNRAKQEDMRRGALEAFALAGIEHYATVG